MTQQVVTNTSSPFASKTNWILFLTLAADVLNEALPLVPAQYQHSVSSAVTIIGLILGIVTKTFFSTTISSTSVPSSATTSTVIHNDETMTTEALNIGSLAKSKVE
jgi:hypothetical protein